MTAKHASALGLAGLAWLLTGATDAARADGPQKAAVGLVRAVRVATSDFKDVSNATAAGYTSNGSCVSGPQEGVMGVHYANGALVPDGALDAARPELLLYEPRGGRLRLLGVEYIVIAADWHATHPEPPVLMGQHSDRAPRTPRRSGRATYVHYVGSPNRYGLPAFYELRTLAAPPPRRHRQSRLGVEGQPERHVRGLEPPQSARQ